MKRIFNKYFLAKGSLALLSFLLLAGVALGALGQGNSTKSYTACTAQRMCDGSSNTPDLYNAQGIELGKPGYPNAVPATCGTTTTTYTITKLYHTAWFKFRTYKKDPNLNQVRACIKF